MSNVRKFAALNTKIKGMVGKLLSHEDYMNMLKLEKESEIFEYLMSHTYYGNIFNDMPPTDYTVSNVERQIKGYIVSLYRKILCYISGDYKKLFKLLMKRFEAEDIKSYLRALHLNQNITELYKEHLNYEVYTNLNYKELSLSRSMEEFIEGLKSTMYYKVLKLYLSESKDRMLFYMEMNIDRMYFSKLASEISKFKGDEKPIFEILRMNIDFLNFQWIYRGKKFYKLSPEEVLNYTLDNGHYLNYETLKALSYASDEASLFEIMEETHYHKLFKHDEKTERYLERDMDRYLYGKFLKSDRESNLNMITVVAFTHRLEFEMRDLFTIMEAKHYGIPADELKDYLIRIL
ncbi:MAG: V-type ATPase subunit [Clostridia bacterium]|nr:V-type ATPase subunit [Clostridia bacterium]